MVDSKSFCTFVLPIGYFYVMRTGVVKFYNRLKGYGFISLTDADMLGKEIFVHSTDLLAQIKMNDKVTFDISIKGTHAINVKKA